ncbi:MAG: hypothetical protein M1294_10915, partial [Firmicutes bacterium]|nr:hypothetical protein [Bacillota bacterium]
FREHFFLTIMPSADILFKWSAGVTDGRPNPELWVTAIYAASATWPDESQFLLVRYSDPVHDPDTCWSLACQAATLQTTVVKDTSDLAPTVSEGLALYQQVGSQRYPRFASALQGPLATEATQAAWFAIFREADPTVYAASVRYLLDQEDPLWDDPIEEQSLVWVWLVEAVWVLNGQRPIHVPGKDEMKVSEEDPLWENLKTLWPRLPHPTRQALVTLAQQSYT